MIGLSPLSTGHPPSFQPWWVRSSTRYYTSFNLPMDRSPGFGSTAVDKRPIQTRFRSGFVSFDLTKPPTVTRGLIMQKARGHPDPQADPGAPTACRRTVSGTISLPLSGCFSPFPHGTGSLSVTKEYLALEGGPPRFRQGFTCPAVLGIQTEGYRVSCTGLSPTTGRLPSRFHYPVTL